MLVKSKKITTDGRFTRLAEETYPRLFRAACYYTGNREDAYDLVQETFAAAAVAFENFEARSSFYTWLYTIFRRLLYRSVKRGAMTVGAGGEIVALEEADASHDPYAGVFRSDLTRRVHRAVGRLPEIYRECIILRHFEQFSYAEIAEITGCSIGTVKSRIHTARRRLSKKLK